MKPNTNNMAGLIDNIDQTYSFRNYEPEKGTIYFTDKNHQKFYNQIVRETGTGVEDRGQLVLFYLLSSLKKIQGGPWQVYLFK